MLRVPKLESPADISLMDDPPAVQSTMINDLRPRVNKVEGPRYIEPALSHAPRRSRVLKPIAENARGTRVSCTDGGSCASSSTSCKEIPLGRRKRSDMRPPNNQVTTRMDNSLFVTTKKFIELKTADNTVNLNHAALALNVPKRRLYDITNVLEGIDLVEKVGKNSIRWKTDDGDAAELNALLLECDSLSRQESELDAVIADLTAAVNLVKEDPSDKPYGYVDIGDFRHLDAFREQTLIALKSHPNSQCFIEVADSSTTHNFQMKVRSDDCSPLNAYICQSGTTTLSSIEEILSSGESSRIDASSPNEAKPLSSTHKTKQIVVQEDNKEAITSLLNECTEIVLPETGIRHDSLSDLITPDKVMFQSAGVFHSPLKMLLDPYPQSSSTIEIEPTNVLLTPDAVDSDPYNFPSSGLSLSDLFSSSDWELPL